MWQLPHGDLDRLLEEDVPYGDLTTQSLGIGDRPACMRFVARNAMTVSGVEVAAALIRRCEAGVQIYSASGRSVIAGAVLLEAEGSAAALFQSWKLAQTLVEWASGIASATRALRDAAQAVKPDIVLACTRKTVPFSRRLSAQAVIHGGGAMHRLGLSESVLLFPEHRRFLPDDFAAALAMLRAAQPEQRIGIEVCSLAEAERAITGGYDVIQLEKFSPEDVAAVVRYRNASPARSLIAAAGGVHLGNATSYAAAGADILVSSAPYAAPPAEVAVSIDPSQGLSLS